MKFKQESNYLFDEQDYKLKNILEYYIDCLFKINEGQNPSLMFFKENGFSLNKDFKVLTSLFDNSMVFPSKEFDEVTNYKILLEIIRLIFNHGSIKRLWDDYCTKLNIKYKLNVKTYSSRLTISLESKMRFLNVGYKDNQIEGDYAFEKDTDLFLFQEEGDVEKIKPYIDIFFNKIENNELDLLSLIKTIRKIEKELIEAAFEDFNHFLKNDFVQIIRTVENYEF